MSNDANTLASAQCSLPLETEEGWQAKVILWNVTTRQQIGCLQPAVRAVQCMAFSRYVDRNESSLNMWFSSRDDRHLITVGNYQRPLVSLWSTRDGTHLLNWQDESSLSYFHCLAWNPMRAEEFCLGGSCDLVRFCTITDGSTGEPQRLQVACAQISSSCDRASGWPGRDVTCCLFLKGLMNLVLCATSNGWITCWNSRLSLRLMHWQADCNELCFMRAVKRQLLTGSSTGCLRLWNIETLETHLEFVVVITSSGRGGEACLCWFSLQQRWFDHSG